MASSSRIRQTVLRLIGLFSSSCARLARSVVDWRLNGFPVRATTSQAIEATTARSRGGKDGLAASAGIVLEGKLALRPSVAAKGGWSWDEGRGERRLATLERVGYS